MMSHPCPYDAMNSLFFAVLHPKKSWKRTNFYQFFRTRNIQWKARQKFLLIRMVVFTEDISGVNISLTGACAIGFPRWKLQNLALFVNFDAIPSFGFIYVVKFSSIRMEASICRWILCFQRLIIIHLQHISF